MNTQTVYRPLRLNLLGLLMICVLVLAGCQSAPPVCPEPILYPAPSAALMETPQDLQTLLNGIISVSSPESKSSAPK